MGIIAYSIGVTMDDILKETCRSSVSIPKAMPEVLWEVRGTVLGRERDKMHVETLSPHHRLRFTLVPQTLATWGIWAHTVFEGATLSSGKGDSHSG